MADLVVLQYQIGGVWGPKPLDKGRSMFGQTSALMYLKYRMAGGAG